MVLRPLWTHVLQKALPIIGITGLVAGGTFYLASTAIPTEYEGNFQLLVEAVTNEAIVGLSALKKAPGTEICSLDYATQIEVLKSPKMLSEIYEQVHQRYPKLNSSELKKGLTVERVFREQSFEATILEVRYTAQDPEQINFVLNTVANKYLRYSIAERKIRIAERLKFIDEQIPALQLRVNSLRSRLQSLQSQNKQSQVQADQLQEELKIPNQTLERLLTQREILQVEAAQKQIPWEVISPPQLHKDSNGHLIPVPSLAKNIIPIGGVVLGLLLGVGTTTLIETRKTSVLLHDQRSAQ